MPSLRLSADALTSELAQLPLLSAVAATQVIAAQIAIARAIASGQSAQEIATALATPSGWENILHRSALQQSSAEPTPPKAAQAAKPHISSLSAGAAWSDQIVSLALAKEINTRVAVVDRAPTALGGLELPVWARALSPSAIYGPVTTDAIPALTSLATKWIIVFNFIEMVEFVRAGQVLCVVPLNALHIGSPKQATIRAGSAWIAAPPLAPAAPTDAFAGIAIQSGELVSDEPLPFGGTTVNVPSTATLQLSLAPVPMPAGPAGFPATVTPPTKIDVAFPPTGAGSITFDQCSATLYADSISSTSQAVAPGYDAQLKLLYLFGNASASVFAPSGLTDNILAITGSAPVINAGWTLNISESATPLTLGSASGPGSFGCLIGPGLFSTWPGTATPEPAALGLLTAQNNSLLLYLASGAAPGVISQQSIQLWNDQDTNPTRRCQLVFSRQAGQILTYGLSAAQETLSLKTSTLNALIDRPVLATGARVPANFLNGTVDFISANGQFFVLAASMTPADQPSPTHKTPVFPLALDNALLDVQPPMALLAAAGTDPSFNPGSGSLLLLFDFALVELYLPDPYTGNVGPEVRGGLNLFSDGTLLAEVAWPSVTSAQLRLLDGGNTQALTPPGTEASSDAVALSATTTEQQLISPAIGAVQPSSRVESGAAAGQLATPAAAPKPTPPPLPDLIPGEMLLDVSTRASQFGVRVTTSQRAGLEYAIDGLSVRGPAFLLPLATLPAIAWEPMYNVATVATENQGVSNSRLLHPPGDGPLTQFQALSATLIPVAPLQSLRSVLNAGSGGFIAQFTLPFGMIGALSNAQTASSTVLPNVSLVRPVFPSAGTPTGAIYTGAWQLSITAPDPTSPDPVLAGATYLRTQADNPTGALSYGEQVLGPSAQSIFQSRFNPATPNPNATPGVPLLRYDLTGYGASTFSEWTNPTPLITDVVKSFFHVVIGRTGHEVIQVQSLIYPWAIKVVRTITIDRQGSGVVQRYDSGWQAASDGLFQYPSISGTPIIAPEEIHPGIIGGVINVANIRELGPEVPSIAATPDGGGAPAQITLQAVTFDGDVVIQPQHTVLQGAAKAIDLTGAEHVCIPSAGITGYVGLTTGVHLTIQDMSNFQPLANGMGGPLNAIVNIANSNSLLRATSFQAVPLIDTGITGTPAALAASLLGIPKLSSDGAWSMGARTQSQTAPAALNPTTPVPLVQPNVSGSTTLGNLVHYADPQDILRLAAAFSPPPDTLYGFLQATGTQSNFLSRPFLTIGSQQLVLADALNVAHAGALLGAISTFPDISNCLQFLAGNLAPMTNQASGPSLATTQNLYLDPSIAPLPLISTSIATVNLYFRWKDKPVPQKGTDPQGTVVISLGQPTAPSWSLDINRVAIGLIIPALSSNPILWLEGNFHADADTIPPTFPNLQVVFDSPLDPLTQFFTLLQKLQDVLNPAGGAGAEAVPADEGDSSPGLHVHFSDGKLSVTDNFSLPDLPLGPGTIQNVSLDIGTTLDIVGLNIDFLVGIGTPDTPCHWIVDPLSGTFCIQAGIQQNELDILIQGGIGAGLAIDLAIASGSASIVIAVQVQVQGSDVTLLFLLTGQAQVDVLDGLASACLTITAGLGLALNPSVPRDVNLIGTAQVGIHLSICWVCNIDWSGSWTFQKEINLTALP
jgi:hypothetical protein